MQRVQTEVFSPQKYTELNQAEGETKYDNTHSSQWSLLLAAFSHPQYLYVMMILYLSTAFELKVLTSINMELEVSCSWCRESRMVHNLTVQVGQSIHSSWKTEGNEKNKININLVLLLIYRFFNRKVHLP